MKKLKILLISLFFTNVALADRIEFIPTSTLGGPHGTAIKLIAELSRPAGFDFVPAKKGGCGEAVSIFNDAKGPIAITWSDTMYKNGAKTKQDCEVDFKSAKAIGVFYAPYEVCVLPGTTLKSGQNYTLGNNKFNPRVSHLEKMNSNKQGIKFKDVIYPSSGKVVQGLINKEIDIGIIATGNASPAIKAGSIKCLYTTGSTKYGQKPLSEFYGEKDNVLSEFKLGVMIFVRNFTQAQINKLKSVLAKQDFVGKLTRLDMVGVSIDVSKADIEGFKKVAREKVNIN